MPDPDIFEKKEQTETDNIIDNSKIEGKNLMISVEKFQVNVIINGLFRFINHSDIKKVNDLVDYICLWNLWSHKNEDLERMTNYIIYWSYEKGYLKPMPQSLGRETFTWKLKYILDNYWRDINTILSEINKKEKEMMPKENSDHQEEKWILEWALGWLKDVYNYWAGKLSDLRNFTTKWLSSSIGNWVKNNLFSPERQKNTEDINEIYKKLQWKEKPDFLPFYLAIQWYNKEKNKLKNKKYLTVVDYSKPVSQKRLFVINMETLTVENCVQTWHGKNSGNTKTTSKFSNVPNSNQTSIGFFRTPMERTPNSKYIKTGWKKWWKWLFLNWMEYSNNNADTRWIAVHSVWEFFYSRTDKYHKAGDATSEGCITIRSADNPVEIMEKIKWDSLIYSYYPDMTYLTKSVLIK